ncbi:MAG: ATP-dependent sacrificial sulfur transferase LarE [Planctomycetales bacterium]|nr:ATP-dependent sacrificial sulfur transferase LarE [Planctomycetales bacterium]
MTAEEKLSRLRESLRALPRAVVAFSGGVDSTFLLAVAVRELGDRVLAVTARSESLPSEEEREARDLAARLGARHRIIGTDEVSDPLYAANTTERCYFCKRELFEKLAPIAAAEGGAVLLFGGIADDLLDYRPGARAAGEAGARAPLQEVGLSKAEIRQLSRRLELPTWDKPAMACLSSRVPHGTPVTPEVLAKVERAEAALHALGFRACRVRHHGDVARIEVPLEDLARLAAPGTRDAVAAGVRAAGYRFVALDLEGYRAGSVSARPG